MPSLTSPALHKPKYRHDAGDTNIAPGGDTLDATTAPGDDALDATTAPGDDVLDATTAPGDADSVGVELGGLGEPRHGHGASLESAHQLSTHNTP